MLSLVATLGKSSSAVANLMKVVQSMKAGLPKHSDTLCADEAQSGLLAFGVFTGYCSTSSPSPRVLKC